MKQNGEVLPYHFLAFVGCSDLSKYVHTWFSSGFTVSTGGVHAEDAGLVPADAATRMAILRFLHILRFCQALLVTIFQNRFNAYSADPLDY